MQSGEGAPSPDRWLRYLPATPTRGRVGAPSNTALRQRVRHGRLLASAPNHESKIAHLCSKKQWHPALSY